LIDTNLRASAALLSLVFVLGAGPTASAATPQECAAIAGDPARLACYDAIFRRAAGAGSSAAVAATAPNPEADFGLTESAKRARDPEKVQEELPQSVTSKVTNVSRRPTGELVVTLENGQVWSQVTVDQRARVAAGDTVTVKKAALGSHLLVTAARYATNVRRVR
jgi:hypothetical protein